MSVRQTEDLVRIAAAGGGIAFDAAVRRTDELVKIAAAAKKNGSRVVFRGLGARRTDELVQIAAAGGGAVHFDDF